MPRPPYPVGRARSLLAKWAELRVPLAPEDAPITVPAALSHLTEQCGLPTSRVTLYRHDLHKLLADAERRQREEGGGRRGAAERRAYEAQIASLREANRALDERNRGLLGLVATMTWNARRMGVSEDEMRRPMPKPDRSHSRAGSRTRKGPR